MDLQIHRGLDFHLDLWERGGNRGIMEQFVAGFLHLELEIQISGQDLKSGRIWDDFL